VEVAAFDGLSSLSSLSLDHNGLRSLHSDQFLSSARSLEDLSLNDNHLAEVPQTLAHLSQLRTLDLGENEITELRESEFGNLRQLYGLRIAGNQIPSIKRGVFQNTTTIHVLNLSHNKLSEIEQGAFENLKDLRALRLDNNLLTDINGVVSSLSRLQWFNVSSNRLLWFDYAFVPMSLEWLDIHNNEIEELGNYYNLKSGFNLKTLDASSNLIKSLSKMSLPVSLESVSLSNNAIRTLENSVFEDKPNLVKVELTGNEMAHLKLSHLTVGQVSARGNISSF
jgi:Leucine-rich repeat (LRR) protein